MPASLEILDLSGGYYSSEAHKFTGGIPAEWSSMTNLKELKMAFCGLDGESDFPDIPCAEANREANRESLLNRVPSQTRQTPNLDNDLSAQDRCRPGSAS